MPFIVPTLVASSLPLKHHKYTALHSHHRNSNQKYMLPKNETKKCIKMAVLYIDTKKLSRKLVDVSKFHVSLTFNKMANNIEQVNFL